DLIRSLAAPPISEDDLDTLVGKPSTWPKTLSPELADKVLWIVRCASDDRRFTWLLDDQPPSKETTHAATVATASLIASRMTATLRRTTGKAVQEASVKDAIESCGFVQARKRSIDSNADWPSAGEFFSETTVKTDKADFVARLWNKRLLAVECKES